MKKISFLIAFLISAVYSFAQNGGFPNHQSMSNATTNYHFKGGLVGDLSLQLPNIDTLDNPATTIVGAITRRPQDGIVYLSDGAKWTAIGFAGTGSIEDTIYTQLPLYVDTTQIPGKRILKILHPDGLISGGVVTKADCWKLDVTSAVYYLNYRQFTTPSSTVTVDTADASLPRIDVVVVDTNAVVRVLKGTPSATPIAPQINPSSQIILTTISISAAASCLQISTKIVYDENIEWTTGSTGTISVDFNNTDNPYNGAKAAFLSTYTDSSELTFTDSGVDTVSQGEVLKMFLYVNGAFTNNLQFQFFNDTVPVSNRLPLNANFGFNPYDSNAYQNVSIPLSAFNFTGGNVFNKLIITLAGEDVSGAKGFYVDYVQLQKGLSNPSIDFSRKVDSVTRVVGSDYYWVQGVPYLIGPAGGGGSDTGRNFTPNLIIYTNTLTPTGVLASKDAFLAAIQLSGNNANTLINNFYISPGSGIGEVGLVQMSISDLVVIPEGMFRGNTEITGFSESNALIGFGAEIGTAAFKGSTIRFFNSLNFGFSSNMDDSAFANCPNLISVYMPAWDASSATSSVFRNDNSLSNLTVLKTGSAISSIETANSFTANILANVPSSSVNTIYNADDAITDNRTVNLNGKTLALNNSVGGNFLLIDPTVGSQSAAITSADATGFGSFQAKSSLGDGYFFRSYASDGNNLVTIKGDAIPNSIEYTANTHTFTGSVTIGGVTYPTADGAAGQAIVTNGSGIASWSNTGSSNTSIGSGIKVAVNGTNNIKSLINGYAVGIDSTSNANAVTFKVDTSIIATKSISGLRFVLRSTAPTDTTVAWVDTTINILQSSPIRFWVNRAWSDTSSNSGLYYDRIGNVVSNGSPYKILVGGQSNPGGPYIGSQPNPNASPYNGYYGDTIPDAHVVGWNDTLQRWQVAHIAVVGTPWQYSSGANYVMLLGKMIAQNTGRSVRIVSELQGGTPLEAWSGSIPSGTPDTAYMFLRTKAKVLRSGMVHPDLMIWGQGETGVGNNGTGGIYYYDKLIQFYDTLRRQHVIDTSTIILTHGIGDPAYNSVTTVGIGYAEGSLRLTQYDADIYTGYVFTKGCISDGLHYTPKGHEEIARRLYAALKVYPLDPSRNPTGYRDTSSLSLTNETRKLVADGLQYVNSTGKPYLNLNVNPSFTDPFSSTSGSSAAFLFNASSNTVQMRGYDGTGTFSWQPTRFIASLPLVGAGSVQAYSGSNPYLSISNIANNREWKLTNNNTSNILDFSHNNLDRFFIDTLGKVTIASSLASANNTSTSTRLNIESTNQGIQIPRMTTTLKNAIPVGLVGVVTTIAPGSGYINGTYNNVPLTGGSGTGAQGSVNIVSNAVSSIIISTRGTGYINNDVLSFSNTSVGGSGSGYSGYISVISTDGLMIYDSTLHKLAFNNAVDNSWNSLSSGGGTVSSFSAGNLSPLFTTSVATSTTTPALTFAQSAAAAYTNFGNNTSSSTSPTFFTNIFADSTKRSTDSIFRRVNGNWYFQYKDSIGGSGSTAANPTASIGLSAVNGSAGTYMRSDAAPPIDQTIAPTWTGIHTHSANNVGTSVTDRAIFSNTQAAAVNAQQYSPALHFIGNGWKTTATAASQTVEGRMYLVPVQAAASPYGRFVFDWNINSTGYSSTAPIINSAGNIGGVPSFGMTTGEGFRGAANVIFLTTSGADIALAFSSGIFVGGTQKLGFSATSGGSGTNDISFQRNAAGVVEVNSGTTNTYRDLKLRELLVDATNTATGTTGAQTINKAAGSVNFAATASTLVVTNSIATTSSNIFVQVEGTDATAVSARVTKASGSFTITLNAAATAETRVSFFIIN